VNEAAARGGNVFAFDLEFEFAFGDVEEFVLDVVRVRRDELAGLAGDLPRR
jgi:hypothetical protein